MSDLKICIMFISLIAMVALLFCNRSMNIYVIIILSFCIGMFSESALDKAGKIEENNNYTNNQK